MLLLMMMGMMTIVKIMTMTIMVMVVITLTRSTQAGKESGWSKEAVGRGCTWVWARFLFEHFQQFECLDIFIMFRIYLYIFSKAITSSTI